MSDLYLHCDANTAQRTIGEWSQWNEGETYCSDSDFFFQKFRNCHPKVGDTTTKNPFCKGRWMELTPCGQCLGSSVTETDDYNYDYSQQSSYDDSSYSDDLSSASISSGQYRKRKRRDTPDVCSCQPDTVWEQLVAPSVAPGLGLSFNIYGRFRPYIRF